MKFEELKPGDRIELHPATDLWVRGARFGTVVLKKAKTALTPNGAIVVHVDKIDRIRRFHPENILRRID